jgi:large subunit ribosomal protein L18
MIKSFNANKARLRRHRRVRKRVQGTAERPRLSVFRSAEHIYAQIIDDEHGRTLVAASSLEKAAREATASVPKGGAATQQAPKSDKGAKLARAEAEAPADKGEKPGKGEKAGRGEKAGKGGKAEQAVPAPAVAEPAEEDGTPAGLKGIATNHKVLVAQSIGRLIAERARERGITRVVFDRGGYIYHGRVAALAAGAREGGLDF